LPPKLMLDGKPIDGVATDGEGLCWAFLATGLTPSRDYTLTLSDARGRSFDDAWSLRTFPAPSDSPTHFRLMAYTCAGGHERSESGFLPLDVRRRLLARGLAEKPDALVANGDHVYWDLRTRPAMSTGTAKSAIEYAREFDRTLPVLRGKNEGVLRRAVAPQIADLYGTLPLKSRGSARPARSSPFRLHQSPGQMEGATLAAYGESFQKNLRRLPALLEEGWRPIMTPTERFASSLRSDGDR
jgi:hypothetical protein